MDPKDRERLEREITEHLTRAANALARGVERVATHVEQNLERSLERRLPEETSERRPRRDRRPRVPFWIEGIQRIGEEIESRQRQRDEARRQRRAARREAQRREALARASMPVGLLNVAIALVLLAFALQGAFTLWWLVFPAIVFASAGGRQIGLAAERRRLERASAPPPLTDPPAKSLAAPVADPRDARVEAACDKLLVAVKDAPESIRAFLGKPEKTVEQLRATARQLSSRERALRELVDPADEVRLARERAELGARVSRESDEVVRSRLAAALAALDQQLAQRDAIAKNAARLEAEHLRLAYTLEGLHAQVVRMRAAELAGADVANEAMQQSVEELRTEVAALADALEQVNAASPVTTDESGGGAAPVRTR